MEYELIGRVQEEFNVFSVDHEVMCEIIPRKETVVFKLVEDGNEKIRKFGVVDKEEVYKLITDGKEINLNYCYIEDFSLEEYKRIHRYTGRNNVDKDGYVLINYLSAINAFIDVDLTKSTFEGGTNFSGTMFATKTNFIGSTFKGKANFIRSTFKGVVKFNGATFERKANFIKSIFEEDVNFTGSIFKGEAVFFESTFKKKAIFTRGTFAEEVLFNSQCDNLILSGCLVRTCLDIRTSPRAKIDKLEMINLKNLGHVYFDWKVLKQKIYAQESTDFSQKANQIQTIKENYSKLGWYEDEDEAYLEFKRYEMKSKLYDGIEKPKKNIRKKRIKNNFLDNSIVLIGSFIHFVGFYLRRLISRLRYVSKWLVLDKMGGFGTKPMNVFISMIIVISAFSITYYFLPSTLMYEQSNYEKGWTAIYHSIVTFLTIGNGNVSPEGALGILISGFEGFIGLFLMSYFTVAFVRKILR